MKSLITLMLWLAASIASAAPAYQLDATEVVDLRAAALQRDYQLYIALPDSWRAGQQRYPVLFVTDANYAFPVVRNIAQRLHKHAGMEEVIVVGLSYANGDTPGFSRRRDYTPSVPRGDYRSDMPGRAPAFGAAQAYGRFLANEVMPLVARRYRADLTRAVFIGHSYGSLLGLQILLDRPATFAHYILGSPSLWFDGGVMFDREQAYAARQRDLRASVYFGIGSTETRAPGKQRSRAEENADMLADLRDFRQALTSRHYPGLSTTLEVFEGEDHASVFPFLLTHGLRTYLHRKP
ncbi:alpha/beta hydrolase [Massilia sp. S19_KUP03_FR1]|uniref:alpha/beta hydrolase n=1 Tax=Massilia sp. S19_KUP03_FR1 TaxID=3025503 RepID=UPI002FCD8C8C